MTQEQINIILKKHQLWLEGEEGGECADFQDADLQGVNFQDANLQCANLQGVNFQGANLQHTNLRYANLQGVNFQDANLQGAYLQYANLQGVNFQGANLQHTNLRYANLQNANLDYSCFPLWCGGSNFKADIKLAYQLLAHLCTLGIDDPDWQELKDKIMPYAKKSHRATDLGI